AVFLRTPISVEFFLFNDVSPRENPFTRVAAYLVPCDSQVANGEHKIDSGPIRPLDKVTVQQAQLTQPSLPVSPFRKYANQRLCGRADSERAIHHGEPHSSEDVDSVLRFA